MKNQETPKPTSAKYVFFRTLLAFSLLIVGAKYYFDIEGNHGFVSQNLRLMAEKFKLPFLRDLRQYSELITLEHTVCIACAGFLLLIGTSCAAKLLMLVAAITDLALIHNPYFIQEPNFIALSMLNLGLLGAVLNN